MPALRKQHLLAALQVVRVDAALFGAGEDADDAAEGGGALDQWEEVDDQAEAGEVSHGGGIVEGFCRFYTP